MQGKRNIAFMQELQCLFALMLGTWRKFVDPSAALELLRDVFRSAEQPQVKPRCSLQTSSHSHGNPILPHPAGTFRGLFPCLSANKQLSLCH